MKNKLKVGAGGGLGRMQKAKAVKKLLPGGLLTASMRALVRAGQRTKQATVSDRMLINKSQIELAKDIMKNNPKKFRSSEDKLGPDVVDTIARRMAKNERWCCQKSCVWFFNKKHVIWKRT